MAKAKKSTLVCRPCGYGVTVSDLGSAVVECWECGVELVPERTVAGGKKPAPRKRLGAKAAPKKAAATKPAGKKKAAPKKKEPRAGRPAPRRDRRALAKLGRARHAVFFLYYPARFGLSLAGVYVVWGMVILAMYPACVWFAGVKARRREWWLSYL